MEDTNASCSGLEAQLPLDLTLSRAAAAFRDADFFESCALFWSAGLDHITSSTSPGTKIEEEEDSLTILISALDLEQELGLDVQAEEPIDLVFPATTATEVKKSPDSSVFVDAETISPIHNYVLTALCYLARHINVRMDILPSGQDTLTSLGPPQRYYISLTDVQKQTYHAMLAVVLATASSIAKRVSASHGSSLDSQAPSASSVDQHQLQVQQSTIMGNSATVPWQATLPHKRTPHNLPRFFSFLNTSSCTVAGSSIPRNEQDIDAFEQAGFRLVITLIKESPLSAGWFHHQKRQEGAAPAPKRIRNAFVPIENRKAPGFPEVFEVMMGWCARIGNEELSDDQVHDKSDGDDAVHKQSRFPHQRATLVHCGGGKGRAGIVLAAHLIRFGLNGHEGQGYCIECIRNRNVHPLDLEQFRKGFGDQGSIASTLPTLCSGSSKPQGESDENFEEDGDNEEEQQEIQTEDGLFRAVRRNECLNRYQRMMSAADAIAYLREIRPGSIESVEQEKAIKAYGNWTWKQSSQPDSKRSSRDKEAVERVILPTEAGAAPGSEDRPKVKKEAKKDSTPKVKPTPPPAPPPLAIQDEAEDISEDEFSRGRKSGKKGKKGAKKMPQEAPRVFVPPPADKIIKIPGSQHHQHHLVVQHNMRARQLQRGQKSKKNKGGNGKDSKERPSFSISGSPLISAPKLVILAGLPGSGKSHLVMTLLQEFPEHFVRISQDELGSRAVCERLLAQSMRHQQQSLAARGPKKALPMTIFLDRCNPTAAERKEWYEVAFQPEDAVMIWFSRGVEQCIERVDSREGHPTVTPGMGSKVVRSFAKGFEFPNLSKEGSWCKTLIEVGDDEGIDQLLETMRKFAKEVPTSSSSVKRAPNTGVDTATSIKARPAFIPARVLQRKNMGSNGQTACGEQGNEPGSPTHSKLGSSGGMESLVEEDEEDEGEEEEEEERDNEDGEDSIEGEDDDDDADEKEIHTDAAKYAPTPVQPVAFNDLSISRALQFASLTGHRPAVKKPVKGAWMGSSDAAIDTSTASTSDSATQGLTSPRGVSFATPLTNYDRPLQKFPRTPHLFDPLTIHQSREQGHDRVLETEPSGCAKDSGVSELSTSPPVGRSAAISRSDLLLPPSALDRVFAPKAHQVLTVEEKMDGANIGFSVLHFKTVHGFAGVTGSGPPPKIRVQNRNHFVHPDDHWQFKKLTGWLENHREDILYLCEGRWRYETRKGGETAAGTAGDHQKEGEMQPDAESEDENKVLTDDGEDEHWTDEDEDEDEYVDEDKVLQDGLAPYVLYGEWLYAKHSVQYTALRSWFVPFDLYDVKTGTFVSRALFRKAIAQTQLTPNPAIQIPEDVSGDVDKVLQWTMDMLQSRSALMRGRDASSSSTQEDRVEGLYFRIDQGDRLLMRSKVVRPDFIVGEERWGTKEQVANQLVYYLETLPDYDNDDDNDNDNEKEDEDEDEDDE